MEVHYYTTIFKVMDAEKQRTASEKEHLAKSAAFTEIEAKVKTLEKKLSRHIEKSKPYFEQKDVFNKALNAEKTRVQQLQVGLGFTCCCQIDLVTQFWVSSFCHHRRGLPPQNQNMLRACETWKTLVNPSTIGKANLANLPERMNFKRLLVGGN